MIACKVFVWDELPGLISLSIAPAWSLIEYLKAQWKEYFIV
jgi:hypothetical protein